MSVTPAKGLIALLRLPYWMMTGGLSLFAFLINWLSFVILLADSVLLVIYSAFVKRKSGFAANVLVGLLVGTAFIYGEATVFQTLSLVSLSLYTIWFGTI